MRLGKKRFLSFPPGSPEIISPAELQTKTDFLDWLAQVSERIRPYSAAAFGIALTSVAAATLLRFAGGWASTDLRFAIYLPAVLATGLLAGTSAAIGAAIASILIIFWAFMPPYFEFKWPSERGQINFLSPSTLPIYARLFCKDCDEANLIIDC